MNNMYITSNKEAKNCIGQQVWWDDHSSRYVMLRTGFLDGVSGGNIDIEGNWLWRNNLKDLRNFEKGGAFREPAQ
tara:strand:+ start:1833 stop:2057 length:225 start_codon:yes stop_codon:yes gene_type:complete